jgi:nucleotide-binding universal stress UspA family protein
MALDERPAVVAFDGSDAAGAAVRAAATLFAGRRLLIVSVWEPGLAFAMAPMPDVSGVAYMAPSPDQVASIDRAQRDHADDVAEAGARLAREAGATAEAVAVSDELAVAETIIGVAEQRDACALVVGSRGLGGVKAMFGSTSRSLLHQTERPVLVVRGPA